RERVRWQVSDGSRRRPAVRHERTYGRGPLPVLATPLARRASISFGWTCSHLKPARNRRSICVFKPRDQPLGSVGVHCGLEASFPAFGSAPFGFAGELSAPESSSASSQLCPFTVYAALTPRSAARRVSCAPSRVARAWLYSDRA